MLVATSIIDEETGKYIVVEMPDPLPQPIFWHEQYINKPIQLVITNEIKNDCLMKKAEHEILGNYPEIANLLEYVKTLVAPKIYENGNLYIYLDEIYPEHELFLKSFGIQIN